MPENTSHTFFDRLVEVMEQAQKEAEAAQGTQSQRASKSDVDKARREMAREKMEEESKSPLGEKFDARKMVIYSEIMNPKYKD